MESYHVKPETKVHLDKCDAEDAGEYKKGKQLDEKLEKIRQELDRLQELLYAERKHKVLIVLQAMDTAGKDGTISHVFEGMNPQGVKVASFKAPTPEELDHDYLWRVHKQIPGKGEIVIFNRSHYEDVLVVRVHKLITKDVWQRRYNDINNFEHMLADEGTIILKFFLHITPDEQKRRLQDRLDDPAKHWKFSTADLAERKLWPNYMKAYEDAISATSTPWAPWYIVPANKKWFRNLVVASTIMETLEGLKMHYPESNLDVSKIVIE
jgi:PPK2 family polyphosphate:nucleotide phosphotransferase